MLSWLCISPEVALGQQADVRFRHLSFREGLVQSPVTAMLQDKKGFVWVGNWKGLVRYDGYEFKNFHYDGKNGLSKGRVNALLEDRQGRMWVATANGLNLYDPAIERFRYFGSDNQKGGRNYIAGIAEDAQGNIWAATFAGFFLVDTLRGDLSAQPLVKGTFYSLLLTNRGLVWLGTKKGVRAIDLKGKKESPLPSLLKTNRQIAQSKILFIRESQNGMLWLGTEEEGLFCIDENAVKVHNYTEYNSQLPSNMIRDMLFDRGRYLWIATRGGLSRLDIMTGVFSNFFHDPGRPTSIYDNSIWSLMLDRDLNLWAGTFSGAISYLTPNNANFNHLGETGIEGSGLKNPIVYSLVSDGSDGLWMGTFGGGLHHFDPATGNTMHYAMPGKAHGLANQHIKSMARDAKGRLWLGTLNGLFVRDGTTASIAEVPLQFPDGKLSGRLINCLLPSHEGLWIGANGVGLYYMPFDKSFVKHFQNDPDLGNLTDNFVNAFLEDGNKGLWIGTQSGMNYLDSHTFKITKRYVKKKDNGMPGNDVQTLYRDSKNRIWLGTEGSGLAYFDEKAERFYSLGDSLGLNDGVIHAILEDRNGHLWISSDNGLFMIKFRNFKPPFTKGDVEVSHYSSQHGLPGNMYMSNASYAARDGGLYFGGINGLTSFYPDRLYHNSKAPAVVFTGFMIRNQVAEIHPGQRGALNESITEAKELLLTHDQNYISLKYAGINYLNPQNNEYAYKLEGLKNDVGWNYVGHERVANYTNLDPGEYVFKVRAANSDGVWSPHPAELHIRVLPAWYETWWAYTGYALVALSLLASLLWFVRSRELLKRDLWYEHQKMEFFTNVSHEIRTPLTLITAPLERMVQRGTGVAGSHTDLLRMHSNALRLKKLINELLDFRKIEAGRMKLYYSRVDPGMMVDEMVRSFAGMLEDKRLSLEWARPETPMYAYLDRDQMEKVLTNLLSNAIKFVSDDGQIRIRMQADEQPEKQGFKLTISDNGPDIGNANLSRVFEPFWQARGQRQGTGIGLALSKKIVEAHGGTLKATREAGFTCFQLQLPLLTEAPDPGSVLPEQWEKGLEETGVQLSMPVRPLKILIVEDHTAMRAFLKDILSPYYAIWEAVDGEEGWEAVLAQMPDLVLSDVMMPVLDGTEFCARIKSDERTNHIPVLLLTASMAQSHRLKGLENGADLYLSKPFSVQELELQIRNILAAKETFRKKFGKEIRLFTEGPADPTPNERFLQKLMDIINQHMDDPDFGVPQLAAEAGMSKSILYEKLTDLTGLPVAGFIKSVRLQKAAMLLKDDPGSVAEVAFSVGFNDRKYFSREFRKQYGVSPSEFGRNEEKNPS